MRTPRIRNRDAGSYADRHAEFRGSNMYGLWRGPNLYIAWSYNNHFPMVVWDAKAEAWFHNSDRYSMTTSKHQTYVGQRGQPMTTTQLQALIYAGGVVNLVSRRMESREEKIDRLDREIKEFEEEQSHDHDAVADQAQA